MAKITVGICCMKKKLNSDSMAELLQRLQATGKFTIIRFKESMILHEPVENWPIVACLLAFASSGFPLPKAIQYLGLPVDPFSLFVGPGSLYSCQDQTGREPF